MIARLVVVVVALAAVASSCAPPRAAGVACNGDLDCPRMQACVGGLCTAAADDDRDGGVVGDGGAALDGGAGPDGGAALDGGVDIDGGSIGGVDGGDGADAGPADDGGVADAGLVDAGLVDAGDWWDLAWPFRVRVAIDNVGRGALVDVPVLVRLDDTRVDVDAVGDDAASLRFVDDDDGVVLAHEVERWTAGLGGVVWVKVPAVDADAGDDGFTLYYGHPDAPSAQDPSAVWSNDFAGVWHMREGVADGGFAVFDSTGAGHVAYGTGAVASVDGFDGGVGDVLRMTGDVDAWLDVPTLSGTAFPQTAGTVELWMAVDVETLDHTDGILDRYTPARSHYFLRGISDPGDPELQFTAQLVDAGSYAGVVGGDVVADRLLVVAVFDAPAGRMALYVDGEQRFATTSLDTGFRPQDQLVRFGSDWDGVLDEARISSVARSPDWIAAQHASFVDALLTYGAVEAR